MNIKKDKYIILEIIPTNLKSRNGVIIQLCALKIEGLKLLERFNYRLKDEFLPLSQFKDIINYDNDTFNYVESDSEILEQFNKFSEKLPILILDNIYTKDYLVNHNIEYILDYIPLEYNENIINDIMVKYNLQPSNHIVDLLYEALMMEN